MSDFTIYSIGGGALLHKGFNAVAMLLNNGGTLKALIRLGLFTGGLMATTAAFYQMSMATLFRNWALPAFMMLNLCFLPKAHVRIIDKIEGGHIYKVANVPWLLAATAGTTSTVFKVVTEKFEQAFSEVEDLQYTKTGVMFGSQLVKKSKMFKITDPVFNENLKSFVNQCVTFAALRGVWYTIEDLRHSKDLWGLISSKSNWVIHFRWKEPGKLAENCPCREGITRFNAAWKGVIHKGLVDHGAALYPGHPHADVWLKKHLPLAFEQMLNIQAQAEDIMKQQMMTYALMEAVEDKNYQYGNQVDMAISRAHLAQEMTHGVLWGMAAEHLPAMKAVFEMLIYMCLLLVVPLVFLPHGYKILGMWMGLVFWVHLWTPLFAIIYGMVTFLAQKKGIGHMGAYGYTLVTSVGVTELQKTMESVAGGLSMSIPFLSYALVRGGAGSFVHLASHLGSVSQGASSQAAHEAMTGNYSAGNMHFGTTTMATNSSFRQDHGASYSGDTFTHNDGVMSVQTSADGSVLMNQSASHMRFKMDASQGIASGLNEQAQISHEMGEQAMAASTTSEADSYRQSIDYALRHGQTIQNTDSWGRSETTSQDKAVSKVHSLAKDFAKENKMSTEQAAQLLVNASVGASGDFLSGSIGGQYRSSGEKQELFHKAQKFSQDHRFEEALRNARQSIIEGRYSETDETQKNLADGIAASVEKSHQYREEAHKHHQRSQSYSHVASFAQNKGFSINRDETQEFLEWMAQQPSSQGAPMGMDGVKRLVSDATHQDTLHMYQSLFMQTKVSDLKSYIEAHPSASPEEIQRAFNKTSIQNPVSTNPMNQVRNNTHASELQNHLVPSHSKKTVAVEMAQDRQAIENQGQTVVQQGQERTQETEKGLDQSVFSGAVTPMIRKVETAAYVAGTILGATNPAMSAELKKLQNKTPGGGKK